MKSIALNNERYWDASGLYDSSIHKTQQEINATIVNDEMLASVEYNTASGKNHEIGELIIFDGKVCRVTSHIGIGDNIIIGQNVRETTIANEFRTESSFVTFSSVWTGNDPYTQTVRLISSHPITQNTKVDIQVNNSIANKLISDSVRMLYIENNNGTLTAYAVGGKPKEVFSVQCTLFDVVKIGTSGTVLGAPVILFGNSGDNGSGENESINSLAVIDSSGGSWDIPYGTGNINDISIIDNSGNTWYLMSGSGGIDDLDVIADTGDEWHFSKSSTNHMVMTLEEAESFASSFGNSISGDIMIRTETGATWTTPANSPISGDMRPITSDAVYTAIGNINALLATI